MGLCTNEIHWYYCFYHQPNIYRMMEWPFEVSVTVPARWQYFARLGQGFQKAVYTLSQCPIFDTVSPIARIHESFVFLFPYYVP